MHDHLQPAPVDLPTPAASLIPHRSPVRLVEERLGVDIDGGMTATVIREGTLFLHPDGSLDRRLYLELIAQTFAASKTPSSRSFCTPVRRFGPNAVQKRSGVRSKPLYP